MQTNKKVYIPVLVFLATVQGVFAFSMQSVISPISGVWANKQPLVLNLEPGEEVFYSFSNAERMPDSLRPACLH